jgi:hypothetical protein
MIFYCLRDKESLKIHNINELTFVAIHELAHVGCKERNHPPIFWITFKWLLDKAIKAKVYEMVDYRERPFKYCGMRVSYQPYLDLRLP